MGSGAGLGVVLDRKDGQFPVPNAFYGAVIEVTVRHDQLRGPGYGLRFTLNRETVVLTGDQDLPGLQILHRMVSAPMAVGHLHRPRPEAEAQDLVAEADAEDRSFRGGDFAD